MPQRHSLAVSERTIKGKEVKKLRRQGLTPGIIYGPVVDTPLPVSVETKAIDRMYRDLGSSVLIDLTLDGATYVVYMREVDINRIARQPLHAEFYAPNLREPISASVPLGFAGEPGIAGGVLTHGHESLFLRGLPEQLPATIEVDLSVLVELEQSLYVRDAVIPEGIELLTDPDTLLVKLSAPTYQAAEELEAEAPAEAAEEAAEAPAEAETEAETENAEG
jgi:large subunit ribosomal protein L25